jgi:hypothetical protein
VRPLFFGFFLSGDYFQAGPLAVDPTVIGQLRVIAADAAQDLSPLLHLPFEQQLCFAPSFRALPMPDAPLACLFHGNPPGIMILFLLLESKFSEISPDSVTLLFFLLLWLPGFAAAHKPELKKKSLGFWPRI